jgi:hypothetical protein
MTTIKPKVLFICKQRPSKYGASYGLLNSCRFLCNALKSMGVDAKTIEVVDNNGIDREVHQYKPSHVFIEALWVVPDKFDVLIPLHPTVQWHVRLHSNTPFIANEGVAMAWIKKYLKLQAKYPQFHLAPNALKMIDDIKQTFRADTVYTPNIYQPHYSPNVGEHDTPVDKLPGVLSIGCFGAVRPMKNQLIQAMAAIAFADEIGKELHFHINHSRLEQNGDNPYKNMVALFEGTKHKLVEHEWLDHDKFLTLIRRMDLGLQVSFSETFNIVAADFVHVKVPLVGSDEITWLNSIYKADQTSLDNIVSHLWMAYLGRNVGLHVLNNVGLDKWNNDARKVWKKLLGL